MPNMFKVATDKGCTTENNNVLAALKAQDIDPVVQACFLFFLLKELRCESFS